MYASKQRKMILSAYSPKPAGECIERNHLGSLATIKKKYDITVIVPCYNVMKFIKANANSILSQNTRFSMQIIFIDDGSTDGTGAFLDELVYDNVIVIHQKNRGFSGARNTGLAHAQGDYLMFVDSDDILMPGAIESLMLVARKNNIDIVRGNYIRFINDDEIRKIECKKDNVVVRDDINEWDGYPWMKVIRASLFQNYIFPERYWFEDTIMSFLIYPQAKEWITVDQVVYAYRINHNGITFTSKRSHKSLDTFYITELIINTLKEQSQLDTKALCMKFINQIKCNTARLIRAPIYIQKLVFEEECNIFKNYFYGNSKINISNKIDKCFFYSILNRKFIIALFLIICKKVFKI